MPAGKTFFEFGNEPGLYFLLNRRPAVRYSCVPSYQTIEKQREVIEHIGSQNGRPLRFCPAGPAPTSSTAFRIAIVLLSLPGFLDSRYRVVGKVGRRTIGGLENPRNAGVQPAGESAGVRRAAERRRRNTAEATRPTKAAPLTIAPMTNPDGM